MTDPQEALLLACQQVGVDATGAELIRSAENVIYRLPGGVVARVSRDDQLATAGKEVRVSRWLNESGIPAVRAIEDLPQPVAVDRRAVTFWHELPPHREGSIGQLAQVLQQLHHLQPPASLDLPPLAPFVRLEQRIAEATVYSADDRAWLLDHLHGLQERYLELPPGLPHAAVHGDAWAGNIVDTDAGPVLLDLERFALGPPEWDLVSVAVDHLTFSAEYAPAGPSSASTTATTSPTGPGARCSATPESCARSPSQPNSRKTTQPSATKPTTASPASAASTATAHGAGNRSRSHVIGFSRPRLYASSKTRFVDLACGCPASWGIVRQRSSSRAKVQ